VGVILHPGEAHYNPSKDTYTISASGDNTWFRSDDLHYVWKQAEGDVTLSAGIAFAGAGGNPHRKAMLMIRQSLSPDSVYVDVAQHGNGLTSLQYRNAAGDVTREIETTVSGPSGVRIAKRGDFFYISYINVEGKWQYSGASMKLPLRGPFYVGLAVCSHDKDVVETASFSKVHLDVNATPSATTAQGQLYSTLEVVPIASTDRHIAYVASGHFEAPNWLRDHAGFLVNEGGNLERITTADAPPVRVDTGDRKKCNNDHGISPDGTLVGFSDGTEPGGSRVYTVPLAGGRPQRVIANAPSYWHGWSPDGRTLAFTGQRNGDFDIYTIPVAGGEETRLTTAKGLDDGPEYSPDGRYIYFNSERTGHMQIWRMRPDGSDQEQVTHDDTNDWFPHLSPDGKWMVFVAYDGDVTGHPPNKDVTLRLMSLADRNVILLAKLFGGQGTMNVPSWSPDSTQVAFVSYSFAPDRDEAP
jgi:TolB protein